MPKVRIPASNRGASGAYTLLGPSGKNDSAICTGFQVLQCYTIIGFDLSINVLLPYSSSNQLVILAAKVQNKYPFHGSSLKVLFFA